MPDQTSVQTVISYPKPIYLNGIRIHDTDAVIICNDRLFLSVPFLRRNIGDTFLTVEGSTVTLRRVQLNAPTLLTIDDTLYIDMQALDGYLSWNHTQAVGTGELNFNTFPPHSIYLFNARYYRTSDTRSVLDFSPVPDTLTPDGRAVWKDDMSIWIENDNGFCIRYEKEPEISFM